MYRLQWTKIKDVNGNIISPEDFVYHDTAFEYEDYDEALEDRILIQSQTTDKYIRIAKL